MKKLLYISILMFIAQLAMGQNKLSNALYSLKNNELDKAKQLIDAAAVDSMFMNRPETWYYMGHIYKGLFQRDESTDLNSPLRVASINGFKKSIDIDPNGSLSESSRKGIKYLATTIYNQAASTFSGETYKTAIKSYEYHKEVMSYAYPDVDFTDKDIMFKLGLASIFNRLAEIDSVNSSNHIVDAEKVYIEVIALDSDNISANYNLGIIYYNQGVDIVNNMDYSLDLMELTIIQDDIIGLFKKSLPYMKKAYDLNPTRKETLISLQGIYFSLNDIPQSELYKKELELLEGSEPPKQDEEIDEGIQD